MFLRTERLFLRPPWPEDFTQIQAGLGDPAVARNLARVACPYDERAGREWLARPFDPRHPAVLVVLPGMAGAPVIGGCGLNARDGSDGLELGYWFARPFWGNGYATEAVRGMLGYARTIGVRRVHAGHFVDNPRSGRVLAKAGFRPLGRVEPRFSLARGHDVASVKFAIDLDDEEECDTIPVPAAA